MNPLSPDWQTFFAAEINATAALTGLVVVAVSVNLSRIMAHPLLPSRAAEALIALTGALVLASLLLIPRQPLAVQAAECAAVGFLALLLPLRFQFHAYRSEFPNNRAHPGVRALLTSLGGLPMLAAAGLLAQGSPAGLYCAAAGVIMSLVAGIAGAWVLLVEILR